MAMLAIGFGLLKRPIVRWSLAALVVAEVVAVVVIYEVERTDLKATENTVNYGRTTSDPYFRKYPSKGLRTPPTIRADDSGLDPSEEIVGVTAGGKARAYRLEALRDRDRHIVNDLVGGVPVSVVFCDLSNCVQVYSDPLATEPLDVQSAGLLEDEMVVAIRGNFYLHASGQPVTAEAKPSPASPPIPYQTSTPERMTWGEWRRRHPDSDVFVGVPKRVGDGE
jgi:hypothetical protein